MNIDTTLRELGTVDIEALQQAVLAQDEAAWLEQTHRQQAYDVHYNTQSIVLVFCDGWPEMTITKEPGWDRLAEVAVPVMHDIIERFYPKGGTIIRAMAAKLVAGGRITPHIDSHPSFRQSHRIHIPVTSNSGVRFMIDGRPYQFEVGQAYEINNQKRHSVMNRGKEDRITFIFDYAPPGAIDRDVQAQIHTPV
ncbi:MAG: aspartyl/asparaginyl beta-hydroxylase domain-containing protein [Gammaproteobacteria bacterium]|nr:aspartyl/asparaginyl beta-hydroxylase domain-containing protein [Gammaproteobacteria bacterium]